MADDERLMRQFQQGGEAAYEELVQRWETPMLNFFYRALGDFDAAQDLRQDLFVRVYQHRDSFEGRGTFKAWLYSIATNLLRTHFRKARPMASLDGAPGEGAPETPEPPAPGESACEAVLRGELSVLVRRLLDSLPPDDRQALVLRFYEHLPYHEIAAVLGVAEPTAKSRVYRALERLRRKVVARGLTVAELI